MIEFKEIFKIGFIYELNYKFYVVFKLFFNIIPLIITLLIWNALYNSNTDITTILSQNSMIGYIIFANIAYNVISVDAYEISSDIKDGNLNQYLLKPIHYIKNKFMLYLSKFIFNFILYFFPIGIFCCFYSISLSKLLMFFSLLFVSFLISFFINCILSLLAFWFMDVSALFSMLSFIMSFLAGTLIPIDLMPDFLKQISFFLPFRYLGYETASILFFEKNYNEFLVILLGGIIWTVILYIISKILWKKGIKIYGAYGG